MKQAVLLVLGVLALLAVGGSVYVATYKPKQRPAATAAVERTPARLARGAYLVENVLGCFDCHSKHDLTRFGGPPVGPKGAGGDCFGEAEGFPGKVCTSNITPDADTGIGAWSDGEIMRAIREGVNRQGKALFPLMPYTEYKAISDDDVRAVVAYLRALPPAKNPVPPAEVKFPLSFFVKLAPQALPGEVPHPDERDRVAYGKYLAKVSGCQFCHTPVDSQHQPLPGQELSGGQEFRGPWGVVRSSNLTPHPTGLGDRTEQAFVGMFKAFAMADADVPKVSPEQNTAMPWLTRARMTEADLGAIYAYLKTVPARDRTVEKRPRPALPASAAPRASDAAPAAAPSQ
jgi:mono/diheme cytochrome c family protein